MHSDSLVRLGAAAAVMAAALRTVSAFVPAAEPGARLEALYLLIDILILLGVLGIYAASSRWVSPDLLSPGFGVVLLAAASWRAHTLPAWVAVLWMKSMAPGIAASVSGLSALAVLSGTAFGIAFLGAGSWILTSRPSRASPRVVTGVAEIVLSVRDLPRMRDFYQEVLGFPLLSEACHEQGPEPEPGGEATIAFLTIRDLDTPLGRHGHPQVLALIDCRRHVFAKAPFDGTRTVTLHAESSRVRDSAGQLRVPRAAIAKARPEPTSGGVSRDGGASALLR